MRRAEVLAECEETTAASLEWMLYLAGVVRYRGALDAWKWSIMHPGSMTDEEAREVVSAALCDAAANEPTFFARFKAERRRLEEAARMAGALFEAQHGRPPRVEPIRSRPPYPPIQDMDSRVAIFVMAVVRAQELPAEPPEDWPNELG